MTDLKETIELMTSADHRDRFLAEYWQTKIRIGKLDAMLEKYDRGELDTNSALREKMLASEVKLREAYSELEKLRAQMEVVRLIFGGK